MAASDDPGIVLRRFAAGIAHELNNALTAVLGIADMIAHDADVAEATREDLGHVTEHARRIEHLARRLSAFGRGELTGATPLAALEAVLEKALPLVEADVEAAHAPEPAVDVGDGAPILLVDDEEVVRTIISWQLEGLGRRILPAGTAEEALALQASVGGGLGLAILDLVLPDGDGIDLSRRLRLKDPGLPVIMLTGAPPGDAEAEASLVWLAKPVALGALQRAVRQLARG